jgi:hypothetical protein
MTKKFNLPQVALYAKNWYKRSDNIWDDMKKLLTADGYYGDSMVKEDIITVVSNHCFALDDHSFQISTFINSMIPSYTWKFGYYHKDVHSLFNLNNETNEYDYFEAVLRYCLSGLVCVEIKLLPELNVDYTILPKKDEKDYL